MNKNKLKFISSEKKRVYAELWKKNKTPLRDWRILGVWVRLRAKHAKKFRFLFSYYCPLGPFV